MSYLASNIYTRIKVHAFNSLRFQNLGIVGGGNGLKTSPYESVDGTCFHIMSLSLERVVTSNGEIEGLGLRHFESTRIKLSVEARCVETNSFSSPGSSAKAWSPLEAP